MVDSIAPGPSGEYAIGDVIAGKYQLERLLGEGGQAWVWQARNLALDAGVAIKFLRSGESDAPQAHRLLQEARAAASLGHPGIVRVFDLGQAANGDPFLVMELLAGESLADRLFAGGPLAPIEAIRVLLPIADALAVAHAKGIVHRDIKPDNVFLARSEGALQPKLVDFGIVKVQAASDWQRLSTLTGAVVGSPAYLSPEQARGFTDIDQRVDVWGLCVTLYESLTGYLPFDGANYNALLRSIVEDEPASILEHGVDEPELWEILRRGLAKSRDERWPSTLDFGRALAQWANARGVLDDATGTLLDGKWLSRTSSASGTRLAPADSSVVDADAGSRTESSILDRRVALVALATVAVLVAALLANRTEPPVGVEVPEPAATPSSPPLTPTVVPVTEPSAPAAEAEPSVAPAAKDPSTSAVSSGPRHGASRPSRTNATVSATPRPQPAARPAPSADLYLISPY